MTRKDGAVVPVPQEGLRFISRCKLCGQRVAGSHASIPLGANIKRVNYTQESLCVPAVVNDIYSGF